MKRYKFTALDVSGIERHHTPKECKDGEWVRYEDAIWMINNLMDEIKAEREACAKLCDELADSANWRHNNAYSCAEAIRARGEI